MSRVVRGALIQATLCEKATSPVARVKQAMIDKHVAMIADAANRGARKSSACKSCSSRSVFLRRTREPDGTS